MEIGQTEIIVAADRGAYPAWLLGARLSKRCMNGCAPVVLLYIGKLDGLFVHKVECWYDDIPK